jgi:CHAD domain-containing protein
MAHKRGVTKQDTSLPPAKASPGPLAHWTAILDAFNAASMQCVEDADAEAVHRLRTGSRRLQAMLEAMLHENASPALQQPARDWLRQLKQTRRVAGGVRDLDVHRKLLENWVGSESPTPEAEKLGTWLKGERKHRAQTMQKQIRKLQQALAARQAAFVVAFGSVPKGSGRTPRSTDAVALEAFVRAADAMPLLDAENLHDFRKATKKARYVAESGAQGETYGSVAKALKRVQDAIGDWHDWLSLLAEAKKALGEDARDLTAAFEREVERQFASAMKTTQTMRAQLVGEWMASRQPAAKRPPVAATIGHRRLLSGF